MRQVAAAACGLLAVASGSSAQAPPVFEARVETVYVDAFVTRNGLPVLGLAAADLELKDNGVAQAIDVVSNDSVPVLAVLAFDVSGSVDGAKLQAFQAASAAFLDGLREPDEAGLLTFCEEIEWLAPTRDKSQVRKALAAVRPRGGTAMWDALYAAVTLPDPRTRPLVVMFSDGEDNLSWLDEKQVRLVAERSNALVHVVVLRPPASPPPLPRLDHTTNLPPSEPEHLRLLRQIAEATGGRLWQAETPDKIRASFAAIAAAMGHRYVLRYEPQGVARTGWHRLELRVRSRPADVHARRGYWVAP